MNVIPTWNQNLSELVMCPSYQKDKTCDNLNRCPYFHDGIDCQRFFKTKNCSYGARCKYKHRVVINPENSAKEKSLRIEAKITQPEGSVDSGQSKSTKSEDGKERKADVTASFEKKVLTEDTETRTDKEKEKAKTTSTSSHSEDRSSKPTSQSKGSVSDRDSTKYSHDRKQSEVKSTTEPSKGCQQYLVVADFCDLQLQKT
jgi:uncharacterized membrane protein